MTFQNYIKDYADVDLMGAVTVSEMSARYPVGKMLVLAILCHAVLPYNEAPISS